GGGGGGALEGGGDAAQGSLAREGGAAVAHPALGLPSALARRYEDGIDSLARATALNPNLADAYGYQGVIHGLTGDYEACLEPIERACRLSPYDSGRALWLAGKGIGAFSAGRYDEVVANASAILREFPEYATAYRQRAAALAMLGRGEEAYKDMQVLLRLVPGLTISQVRVRVPIKDPQAMERWLEALRKAGLPE